MDDGHGGKWYLDKRIDVQTIIAIVAIAAAGIAAWRTIDLRIHSLESTYAAVQEARQELAQQLRESRETMKALQAAVNALEITVARVETRK